MISQEILKEHFDYCDGNLVWKKVINSNCKRYLGKIAGSEKQSGYMCIVLSGKTYYTHRLIFLYHHGFLPKTVDHINGNKKDNRIENLREVTQQQNTFNSIKKSTNTSGIKGISWHKQCKRWRAECCINGKNFYLGLFDSIEEARIYLNKKREELHGEFAKYD